ncbi:hypothetical protein C5167_001373 [Papaver somniferum]|uniref:RNase H type-1 domain-containing protein n=1 Tax=Papaver somniferum TaxID=3469 RepID=A0A4Y7KYR0_PAPSO|nr:hypothetical protein C5167_001373 [Papaver somniferum]
MRKGLYEEEGHDDFLEKNSDLDDDDENGDSEKMMMESMMVIVNHMMLMLMKRVMMSRVLMAIVASLLSQGTQLPAFDATAWTASPLATKFFSSKPLADYVIGIDLGASNSCVAVMELGKTVKVIENFQGERTTPTVVAFNNKGELLVGVPAKHQAVTNLTGTIFGTKRLFGRLYEDPQTQKEMTTVPYKIVKASNGDAWVEAHGKTYSPIQISAFLLNHMREIAEAYIGQSVYRAVISVPANFNNAQRQAMVDAAKYAGLEVEKIINDPSAAALSYGLNNKEGLIAILDLGGGTFNVSILEIFKGDVEVLATDGDAFLGGDDFDNALLEHLVSEFKRTELIDLSKDRLALHRLREAAERAKIELSSTSQTDIKLPFITADASGAKHLNITITRSTLDLLVNHLIERIKNPCSRCLMDASLSVKDIDEVVLVGGMTRVPKVQQTVFEIFGKCKWVNPDEAVAEGAAVQGGILRGDYYSTTEDNQSHFCVSFFEESDKCNSLGGLKLSGIPPAIRGLPLIQIDLTVDASGILVLKIKTSLYGQDLKLAMSSIGIHDNKSGMLVEDDYPYVPKDEGILPREIDWSNEVAVSPITSQGECGSCWVFSAIAALEILVSDKTGLSMTLSKQQIVDCAVTNGCGGSNPLWAFRFIKFHGVCTEEDYPYVAHVQKCDTTKRSVAWIDGYAWIPLNINDILCALTQQPLVAGYNPAITLHPRYDEYKGGIYHVDDTPFQLPENYVKHAACIVGWFYFQGQVIFKIRESAGPDWGDHGYAYLAVPKGPNGIKKLFIHVSHPILGLKGVKKIANARIYSLEKSLEEFKDNIPAEVATEIEVAISDLRQVSTGDSIEEIKAKLQIANKAISRIYQYMSGGLKKIADAIIFILEKNSREYKNEIPAEVATEIKVAISDLRQASIGDNLEEIKAKIQISHRAISRIYQDMSSGADVSQFQKESEREMATDIKLIGEFELMISPSSQRVAPGRSKVIKDLWLVANLAPCAELWKLCNRVFFEGSEVKWVEISWPPPGLNELMLCCDGAARGNTGQAGAGAIVRDSSCAVLGALCVGLGWKTNYVTEICAVIFGLELAIKRGVKSICVRSDSASVVQALVKGDLPWDLMQKRKLACAL